ncbi:unnamed protein product (macronuclear) [Paramecium tetraurelia]|uniref:Uncharacterized protein n=1 Tax=Paramecium tetraurelia TaxID=5888 RepID=A0CN09_PARTE|nr:uncharacterized protein GSPATT00008617001 [Paramecium tetraurelia]CAK72176.1 unnamed protein product [Paramecium tetraurelia]|eukprot:XP_001439573.1 hypothetical protein (macronuclear) [Paramecium tetraurelia strain d4-2]
MQIHNKIDILQPIPQKRKIIGVPSIKYNNADPFNQILKAASAPATLEQMETIKQVNKNKDYSKNPVFLIDYSITENQKTLQEQLDEID